MPDRLVQALIAAKNDAADDCLLDALRFGSESEKQVCLDALIRRGTERGLGGVIAQYDKLPEALQTSVLGDIRKFHHAIRECGRSDDQATRLQALATGILVNGRSVSSGEGVNLSDNDEIRTPSGSLRFEATNHGYAGLLLADTEMRLGVVNGMTAELGREPNHPGLAFPDRRGQDNIRWCPGPRAAKVSRSPPAWP